jgi:(p)ppGpp synthase/HD superfamily hydrolase
MEDEYLIDELQNVWYLATEMHKGQKYGGSKRGEQIDYLNHIGSVTFEVMNTALHDKININLALKCAILHDTIEDTALNYEDIRLHFGQNIADGVLALTKKENIQDKNQKMIDSLNRIKEQPKEVWIVKMADRIANLYAPPFYWDNKKKKEYLQESKLILETLKDASNYLATRLSKKIEHYNTFIT